MQTWSLRHIRPWKELLAVNGSFIPWTNIYWTSTVGCPTSHHTFRVFHADFGLQPHIEEMHQVQSICSEVLMAKMERHPRACCRYEWSSHVRSIFACDVEGQVVSGDPCSSGQDHIRGGQLHKRKSLCLGRGVAQTTRNYECHPILKTIASVNSDKGWLLTSTVYFSFFNCYVFQKYTLPLIWCERKNTVLNHIILIRHQIFSSLILQSKLKNLKFRESQTTGLTSWNVTIYSKVIRMPLAIISKKNGWGRERNKDSMTFLNHIKLFVEDRTQITNISINV